MEREPSASRDAAVSLTERYDRHAEAYRELWAPVLRTAALPLVRELRGERVARVLDVGAGAGTLLPDLEEAFPEACVVGIDRSRGMLSLAPRRFGRALVDARQLAIASESVDRVLLVFMLFHLEDPAAGLREAGRVLRRGGRVGTLTWGGDLESTATRMWNECLDRHGAIPPDASAESRHENVDSPEKVGALLLEAGFEKPRSWADELVATFDADYLVRLKTGLGSSKPRFDSLTREAAIACVEEARRRMQSLAAEDFVAHGKVVYAVAERGERLARERSIA